MPDRNLRQPTTLDDMVLYAMWQLQASAGRCVVRLCEQEFGITRREWRLLAQLAPHEGVMPSQLATRAGLDRARTSRTLTSLARKGLVSRTPRPGDRREVLLHLSPAGQRLYAELLPRVAHINRDLLDALTEAETELLDQLLQRLQQRAKQMATPTSARHT